MNSRFISERTGWDSAQAVVWLKENSPEVVGVSNFTSDKQIKTKFSSLKQAFEEAFEDIYIN